MGVQATSTIVGSRTVSRSAFLCLKLLCPPFLRIGFRFRLIYHSLAYAPAVPRLAPCTL
jgi:hypothetical protein